MRFDLTEEEWRIIEPVLPPVRQGGARRDDRQVLDGIFYVLRTGIPWDGHVPGGGVGAVGKWPAGATAGSQA